MSRSVRVGRVGDIPVGRGATVRVENHTLAVFNAGHGRYHVTAAACPHEGGPLGEGLLDRGMILCPWHGFDFDPHTGACKVDPELSVPVYAARVDGDEILVELP